MPNSRPLSRAVLVLAFLDCAWSRSSFKSDIPNGNNVPGATSIGHTSASGGGVRNQFGMDFQSAGYQWTPGLCNLDSDGDGRTNGEELGDPDCKWKKGDTPSSTSGITDPGKADEAASTDTASSTDATDDSETDADDETMSDTASSGMDASKPAARLVFGVPIWVVAHGALMVVAWVFVVPCGILAAVLRKSVGPNWLLIHRIANTSGAILTIAGGAVSIVSIGSHGKSAHSILGLIVFALSVPMVVSGILRPGAPKSAGSSSSAASGTDGITPATVLESGEAAQGKGKAPPHAQPMPKSGRRIVWEAAHKNLGRVLTLLALVTAILGIVFAAKM